MTVALNSALQSARAPFPVLLLLILVILVPIELSLQAGGLFITSSKMFLIVWAFILLPKTAQLEMKLYDWFFIAHVLWSAMCFLMVYGIGGGVERSGTYILEFLIVYLTARVYLREVTQFRAVILALCIMAGIAAILAFPEAISHQRYIHTFFRQLTGVYYRIDYDARMGIMRAASLFEHPILFGIFCSSLVSLAWFTGTVKQRMIRIPVLGFGTFLSASSAPLLIFMLQIWLIILERVTRNMRSRVKVISSVVGVLSAILQFGTGRGIVGVIAMITLSSGTTYIRRTQWQHGIDDVMRHPLFGFEPSTWTRPGWLAPSVDNYWLLMMMRSGIPSILFLAFAIFFIWRSLAKRTETDPLFRGLRIGWGLMMIAMLLGGATVAYFGKLQPLFAFYIGFGAALASCLVPSDNPVTEAEPERGVRYTRFAGGMGTAARERPALARSDAPVPVAATARVTAPSARAPAPRLNRQNFTRPRDGTGQEPT